MEILGNISDEDYYKKSNLLFQKKCFDLLVLKSILKK